MIYTQYNYSNAIEADHCLVDRNKWTTRWVINVVYKITNCWTFQPQRCPSSVLKLFCTQIYIHTVDKDLWVQNILQSVIISAMWNCSQTGSANIGTCTLPDEHESITFYIMWQPRLCKSHDCRVMLLFTSSTSLQNFCHASESSNFAFLSADSCFTLCRRLLTASRLLAILQDSVVIQTLELSVQEKHYMVLM